MSSAGLTFEVESVPSEGRDALWDCPAEALHFTDEVRVCEHGTVAAHLTRSGTEVHVVGEVRVRLGFECSRCTEPFEREITAPLNVVYIRGEQDEAAWTLDPDEDPDLSLGWYTESRIDLTPDVRDAVALSVPMAPVCTPDCKGLCPQCGANLNAGPCDCPAQETESPFAGLDELKAQLADAERARQKDT